MEEFITRAEHREFAEKLEKEDERQNKRLANLEESLKQIYALNTSVEKIALSIETLTKEVGTQNERLKAMEDKPAQNWEKLVWAVGGVVVAAIVALVLKQIGM